MLLTPALKVEESKPQQSSPLIDEKAPGTINHFNVERKINKDAFLNNLNPKYTFDNYLVCEYNEFLAGVSYEVVNNPGLTHNPMFVYSPVGLGKTHISQAIGSKLLNANPSWKIKYVPAETFKQQFIQASQNNKRQDFINSFLEIDLLIIDDIQSLANAEGTQSIFFQIFNQMYQNNKQIVITSDRAPFSLNGFTDRLISRFNSGIVIDIQSPTLEDRIALIKFKLQKFDLKIQNSLVNDIADNVDYSVREIESVVNTIRAKTNLYPDKEISFDDLGYLTNPQEQVSQAKFLPAYRRDSVRLLLPQKAQMKSEDCERILETICKYFTVSKDEITGASRLANIAAARQFAMWALKKKTNLTLHAIGLFLGNRSHATVLHAVRKIDTDLRKKKSHYREFSKILEVN
jgi:chromosomal replication initiator protein